MPAGLRAVLIVAHLLSTGVRVGQIVVFDRGRLTAAGTHEELLATSELYREPARHQVLVRPAVSSPGSTACRRPGHCARRRSARRAAS